MAKKSAIKKNGPIRHAIKQIASHPSVVNEAGIKGPVNLAGKLIGYTFALEVPLPSRSRNKGISDTGVKNVENVMMGFDPRLYPFKTPQIFLRSDFPRSFPHINPGDDKGYVKPCIFDGNINDLIFSEDGIFTLINQLCSWLRKAAGNTLINPYQGWEPIRRDFIGGILICDLQVMRSKIHTKSDYVAFLSRYLIIQDFIGLILDSNMSRSFGDKVSQMEVRPHIKPQGMSGLTVGIAVWPNEYRDDGTPYFNDSYVPDTVTNYEQLLTSARLYGCYKPLNEAVQLLLIEANKKGFRTPLDIPMVLCVRRPYNLIGDNSSLEMIPYQLHCETDELGRIRMTSSVFPLVQRSKLSQNILSHMSTGQDKVAEGRIVILGCGSLGSKIALHLVRGGYGPFTLIDNKPLSPHNLARHALTNTSLVTLRSKAEALCNELEQFPNAKGSVPVSDNIVSFMRRDKVPDDTRVIIDATASDSVREYLAASDKRGLGHPIIKVSVFAEGRAGAILVEGKGRNPRIDDLYIKLFDMAIDDRTLSNMLLSSSGQRHLIGQNCGSVTMIIADTITSLYAAGMAERARQLLHSSFSEAGELNIGRLSDFDIGLDWETILLGSTKVVEEHNAKGWEIRILDNAVQEIVSESIKYGDIETGGIIFGRILVARRCITVSRVLPAPPDSERRSTEFILGSDGLKQTVKKAQDRSGILRYLGTWHSHPHGGAHSPRDRSMLERMKELRFPSPSVSLIYKPTGFSCLVDEGDFGL
jgi:proteasome lid subunit RPN8/RPN11